MPLKLVAALAVAGMIVATAASFAMPRRYVSSTEVRFAPQRDDYRIESFKAGLLSRTSLAKLITGSLDLYSEERRGVPLEDVIDQMTRDVQIRWVKAASRDGAPALGISFAYSDKEKAQAAVREMAAQIVSDNARMNQSLETDRQILWQSLWPSSDPPPPGHDIQILGMASLPQKPVGPSRLEFAAYGLGAGLTLGLLTALVMRWPKSTLRMAGFTVAGGALALGLSWFLTDTYTSTAVLRMLPPAVVPERLIGDVSGGPVAEHFQRLAQEVFSTESLAGVVRKLDLYSGARARKPLQEVAGIMRRNIAFQPEIVPFAPPGDSRTFRISFSYPDGLQAQATVRELVLRFVVRHLIDQRARIEATKNDDALKVEKYGWGEALALLDQPTLPQTPVAPNRLAIAAAGLALGLLLGALVPRLRRRIGAAQPA
jgi:LPS O-antigen subunit length determinant protein (WzzB/FepE family)